MAAAGDYILPACLVFIVLYGVYKDVPVFECFIKGARQGIQTSLDILPAVVLLTTLVAMFKASGAMDVLTFALTPVANFLKLPADLLPLALLRPVSGSSALVLFEDALTRFGPDSLVGRTASVMMGSTETTFYTIAIYFSASRVKNTRHALPVSLLGDLTGFVLSAFFVRLIFGYVF